MKFCCNEFEKHFKEQNGLDRAIEYDPKTRNCFLFGKGGFIYPCWYCPWCGKKLPASLTDEWWDVLEKEYGILDPRGDDREKVPPEFWTDEWWRKRGL